MNTKPRIILVLGMHRSGTSALTGFLNALGASVPVAANTRINPDNPKGHWEHTEANQINDEILRQFGMTWTTPGDIDFSKVSPNHKNRLKQFLDREVSAASSDIVVFKDPRICLLLPLWVAAIESLGYLSHIAFAFRHPHEVASSLNKRNGFSTERGLFLWLQYNMQALRSMSGDHQFGVVFPDWLASASGLYQASSKALGLDWPVGWEDARVGAAEFLDRKLVNNIQHPEPVSWLEKASYEFFDILAESVGSGGQVHENPEVVKFLESSGGWLEAVSSVLLDERQIWREKVNSMYYLINRNS